MPLGEPIKNVVLTPEYQKALAEVKEKQGRENYRDMTLRDHFAARAMQGILSKHDDSTVYDEGDLAYDCSSIAHKSYAMAAAMLAEREK